MFTFHSQFRMAHTEEYGQKVLSGGLHGLEVINMRSYASQTSFQEYLSMVKDLRDQHNSSISVHAPILDVNIGSINHQVRQAAINEIKDSLILARELDASVVVVHPIMGILTMPPGAWSKQEYQPGAGKNIMFSQVQENVILGLQECADFAPDITLGVENLVYPHEIYRHPEQMKELVNQVNRKNVGLTVDIGHAWTCGHPAREFIRAVAEHIVHIHMSDNNGVIDQHLPFGEGTVDYIGAFDELRQIGYQGVITFEFKISHPDVASFMAQLPV